MNNKQRPAKKILKHAPPVDPSTLKMPQVNTEGVTAKHKIVYIIYVPDSVNGQGIIQIPLPSEKQFRRVRRQINGIMGMFRKDHIHFKNEFGQPQRVNLNTPYIITATVEKVELSKKAKDSGIVMAQDTPISQIK